jgi:hypothetical protein
MEMEPAKIVARYANGRMVKGYTKNFFPKKDIFHISPVEAKDTGQMVEIRIPELKGVFIVRDFAGDPKYQEQKTFPYAVPIHGLKVEVTFKDGEVIVGSTVCFSSNGLGFFLFPCDPKCNTLRVFVVRGAVQWVRPLF